MQKARNNNDLVRRGPASFENLKDTSEWNSDVGRPTVEPAADCPAGTAVFGP
jgi:hypothetical protein